MATIGCCRFENTFPDLMDCYDHINDDLNELEHDYRLMLIDLCLKIARDFNGGSHKREMAMKIKMSSKISLQDYADSILDLEYRQPLKTLQEAMAENGWELVDKPTCCEEQINIRSMMGLPYFAQCTVCGKFISDISSPKFSETGPAVSFIDQDKFADDTDWNRTWIAGKQPRGNA